MPNRKDHLEGLLKDTSKMEAGNSDMVLLR